MRRVSRCASKTNISGIRKRSDRSRRTRLRALLERGDARLLDLRTETERRRYGAPPGAIRVSLARHTIKPEGAGAIYLCQHAVRSKVTLRNGAAEVAGGFVAWRRAGLPIEKVG
jgi:rhodanese-related sulfurtransferase